MNNNNIDYEITELSDNKNYVTSFEIYDEFITPDSSYHSKSTDDNDYSQDDMTEIISMEDRALALSLYYDTNYKISDLSKIAEYYNISLTKFNDTENATANANAKSKKKYVKKKKNELIKDIIEFEEVTLNTYLVNRRKELWFYIDELKIDKYLQKHIIFNI
tara:strand:- start:24 stop:509 length:486 start_codon:yes stop_codon:yes gene_type:complete